MMIDTAIYKVLAEHSPIATFLTKPDGTIVKANKAASDLFGYSEKEFMRIGLTDLLAAGQIDFTKALDHPTERAPVSNGVMCLKKGGEEIFLQMESASFLDERGAKFYCCTMKDISGYSPNEQELKITNERFDKILASSLDVICTIDANGYFLQVSNACEKVWGFTAPEMIGKQFIDFVYQPDIEKTLQVNADILAGNSTTSFENIYVKKDGSLVTIQWSSKWDEQTQACYCVARDVSEKNIAEATLMESEKRYRNLFEQNPSPMFIWDFKTLKIVDCNEKVLEKYGYNREEFLQLDLRSLRPEEDIALIEAAVQTEEAYGKVHRKVWRHKMKNGKLVMMDITGHIIDYNGTRAVLVILVDVTEKLKVEELNEFEKRDKEALINTTEDLIWSVSLDYRLVAANQPFLKKAEKVLGIKVEGGDRLLREDLYSPEQVIFWKECYDKALSGSCKKEIFFPAVNGMEGTWVDMNFNPIYKDESVIGIACYSRDVTNSKIAEEKLRRNEASLAQAQQLAKIGSWELDLTTLKVEWSQETYRIFELQPDQFHGTQKDFFEFVHPDDKEALMNALTASFNQGGVSTFEHRVKTFSGVLKVVEERWQVSKDYKGEHLRVSGTCQDITERRQFEKDVRDSEEKYRILFESSPVPKWIYELKTFQIRDVNNAAITHYGYSRQEFLNLRLENLRPQEEILKLREVQKKTTNRQGVLKFGLFTHLKKDQTKIQVEVSGNKISYLGEDCMVVVCNDVTQRELALEVLRDKEAKLQHAQQIAKLGYWQFSPETQSLQWSQEVYNIWELPNTVIPDINHFFSSIHAEDIEMFSAAYKRFSEAAVKEIDLEHRIVLSNGTVKWLHEKGEVQLNDSGKVKFLTGTVQDITPKKLLEISLEDSNRRYQYVTKATSDAIWDWDLIKDEIYWGEGIKNVFGYDYQKMKVEGDFWKQNIHPEDAGRVISSVQTMIETTDISEVNWEAEYRLKRAEGNYAFVTDKGFIIRDNNNKAVRMVGAIQDITKRKESEESIRRSNERFELIGKAANDAVWEWDFKKERGWANLTHQAMFGLTLEDSVPERPEWVNRLHPDEREEVLNSFQQAQDAKSKMWFGEYRLNTDTEGWVSIYDRTYMEYDNDGQVLRKIGSMMDITKRKKEEQHLKLLESVIINANDAVLITEVPATGETDIRIVYVNEAFTKMTGYALEEVKGKSPKILQGEESDVHELKRLSEAIAHFKPCEVTIINYKKTGDAFWINFSVSPVANEKGFYTHWIAVQRDVTEQKLAEIHLNELNESLQKSVRDLAISNADLEQFAFVASHDLQEPLRMVTGFVTQLEKRYSDVLDERGKKYIAFAVDGARRMRQIILDLLEYSKVGQAQEEIQKIDLNELIEEIKILFRSQIEQQKAEMLVDKLPTLVGHISPMRQVFQNLIGNALKYTRTDTACRIHISFQEVENFWEFAVTDNGIGIETEYFEKIFVIFQRLHHKNEFSGTGMGLAITKKIINNLGGNIWIESKQGVGSTFKFTIPKK